MKQDVVARSNDYVNRELFRLACSMREGYAVNDKVLVTIPLPYRNPKPCQMSGSSSSHVLVSAFVCATGVLWDCTRGVMTCVEETDRSKTKILPSAMVRLAMTVSEEWRALASRCRKPLLICNNCSLKTTLV